MASINRPTTMASIVPKYPHPFFTPFTSAVPKPRKPHLHPRAVDDDSSNSSTDPESSTTAKEDSAADDPSFDSRLSQVRLKYRSGTGKKAEQRRAKKSTAGGGGGGGGGGAASKKKVMLPPVPLKEPVAAGGVKVELGFTPYSERLNGRLAALGLAALVLVELGSGKGLLKYHATPTLFLQVYTVAAVAAVFVKYEKERISIWPEKPPSSPASD